MRDDEEHRQCSPLIADVRLERASAGDAVTVTTIGADEPVLAGHYPGFPILPGVCLLECAHRTVLAWAGRHGHRVELDAVDSTRFLNPVFPGDVVTTEVSVERDGDAWRCRAAVSSERSRAADVRLRYRVRSSEEAPSPGPAGLSSPARGEGFGPIGIDEIKRVLPHRYPMLLVDRVTELVPGERVTAVKAITVNEPWYAAGDVDAGYPPVLVIESWCQAAGVLAAWETRQPDVLTGQVILFGSIADIRLPRRAVPGDVLEHRARVVRSLTDAAVVEGESLVGGTSVLEVGRVLMVMRPASVILPQAVAP